MTVHGIVVPIQLWRIVKQLVSSNVQDSSSGSGSALVAMLEQCKQAPLPDGDATRQ
ncbi:hypothetical protein M514_05409 [Trichuris suis]|uniref:Uncharacterized protein n=1 Tax=Trichuris suis TaxID=68888 RepID=A0A085NSG9_9BILA|nr:hypothetical protein M513_05409 [Trichuris suis]KFD72415.1 hypothetical protein M514_05409 [Trichuris suis]